MTIPNREERPHRPCRISLAVLLAALGVAALASPRIALAQAPGVERELAAIRSSLEQIVELMRAEARRSDGAILLRRMELKNARLVPVEERIRRLRSAASELDAQQRRIASMIERFEEEVLHAESEEQRQSLERELEQGRLAFQQMDDQRAHSNDELARLEAERAQLVAELDQLERELDLLEAEAQRQAPP